MMRKVVVREDLLMAALDMMWIYKSYLEEGRVNVHENIVGDRPHIRIAQIEEITKSIQRTSEYL